MPGLESQVGDNGAKSSSARAELVARTHVAKNFTGKLLSQGLCGIEPILHPDDRLGGTSDSFFESSQRG